MPVQNTKRIYYLKNRDRILKRNAAYQARKKAEISVHGKEHYEAHKEEKKKYARDRRQQLKLAAFAALGGKCVHCGFSDPRALQIDHVFGDGKRAEGAERKRSDKFYKHVAHEASIGSPKYQLLCANCNWIKRHVNCEHN